jgi:hypothetical protein
MARSPASPIWVSRRIGNPVAALAELAQHLAAVQPGHQDIQDEQVGVACGDLLQSLFAVGCNRHFEA